MIAGHAHPPGELSKTVAEVAEAVHRIKPRIVVLGDVMLDEYLSGTVDRISPEAPIPVVACTSMQANAGGAANVAANLARLGAQSSIVGLIGEDQAARQLRLALEEHQVNASGLVTVPGRPTTRKLRVVSGGQQIVRVDFEDTTPLSDRSPALLEAIDTALMSCDALVVSDYNKGVCAADVLQHAIGRARSLGIPVLCDPKGRDYGKYAGSNIITPNRREAAEAIGRDLGSDAAVEAAAREMMALLALEACLITLGPDGMLLADAAGSRKAEAFTQEVADVTGAGDSVIAALAIALSCGQSYWRASLFANAVAAIAVSRHGSVAVGMDDVVSTYSEHAQTSRGTKLLSRHQAAALAADLRHAGKKVVFTNGCFDILHAGHVENLERAAAFGSFLLVGLNDDESVRRLKGPSRPVNDVASRARVLAGLGAVDCIVIFSEDTPEALISEIRPDVLVKGSDYKGKPVAGSDIVESYGGRIEFVDLAPGYSSTNIIRKLQGSPA